MPILNLKKNKRTKDKIRLVTQRLKVFLFYAGNNEKAKAGFVFVSELGETRISLYLDKNLQTGTEVRIAFESPTSQAYRVRALSSHRYSLSQKYIGRSALNFRATVQIAFSSEFEREQYQKYLAEVKSRFLFLSNFVSQEQKKAA